MLFKVVNDDDDNEDCFTDEQSDKKYKQLMSGRDRFFLRQDNNIITLCEFIIMYDYVGQE